MLQAKVNAILRVNLNELRQRQVFQETRARTFRKEEEAARKDGDEFDAAALVYKGAADAIEGLMTHKEPVVNEAAAGEEEVHDFAWAIEQMASGNSVRLPLWPGGVRGYLDDNCFYRLKSKTSDWRWVLRGQEARETDWEPYREGK